MYVGKRNRVKKEINESYMYNITYINIIVNNLFSTKDFSENESKE